MAATAFAASPLAGVKLATRSAVATRRTARAAPVRAAADTATATASIGETFAALKKRNQCAFVPFICAGDPNLDATEKALTILDDAGADVIELGVPYSDPLADGPTIQVRRSASRERRASRERAARRRRGRPRRVAPATRPPEPPYRHRIAAGGAVPPRASFHVACAFVGFFPTRLRFGIWNRRASRPLVFVVADVFVRRRAIILSVVSPTRRPPRRARSPATRRCRR